MKNILIAILMVLVGAGISFADLENLGEYDKTSAVLSAGYNWVETEDNSGRAAEYMYQDVSGTASFDVRGSGEALSYELVGRYLSENDYALNLHFDRNHAIRFDLRSEKLYHNLDHIVYDPSLPESRTNPTQTGTPTPVTRATFTDFNPADEYFLKAMTNEAKLRVKLPDMPSHVNVSYWQFQKEGQKQFRFVDEGCAASACHVQSRTRELDRTTHEISAGFDAHLGRYDLIVKHTYRELAVDDPNLVDFFENHFRFRPAAGNFEHSVDPESQMNETTLELHSSLAGGVNLAASGTVGNRKNNSQATGSSPIEAEIDYWKAAADLSHFTSSKFSFNIKARYLDLDNENVYPDLFDPFVFDGSGGLDPGNLVDVRPSVDIRRGVYTVSATYRPTNRMTWKGTVDVEHIKRSETGPAIPFHSSSGGVFENDPVWELPDEEVITKAKLSLFTRPLETNKFKVNGWYQFKNSTDPAYGTSFADSHKVFLSSTYNVAANWGMTGSVSALTETNKEHSHDVIDEVTTAPVDIIIPIDLERKRDQQTVNLGLWYVPVDKLMTSFNYGYNRTSIEQDLAFGADPGNSPTTENYIFVDEAVEYLQEVHTVTATATANLSEQFKVNLSAYYTRSLGFYDPDFSTQTFRYITGVPAPGEDANATSDDLKDITRYDIDQYGVKAGVDHYITSNFEIALNYSYDDYDEKYTDAFDGSVQTAMANLAYRF